MFGRFLRIGVTLLLAGGAVMTGKLAWSSRAVLAIKHKPQDVTCEDLGRIQVGDNLRVRVADIRLGEAVIEHYTGDEPSEEVVGEFAAAWFPIGDAQDSDRRVWAWMRVGAVHTRRQSADFQQRRRITGVVANHLPFDVEIKGPVAEQLGEAATDALWITDAEPPVGKSVFYVALFALIAVATLASSLALRPRRRVKPAVISIPVTRDFTPNPSRLVSRHVFRVPSFLLNRAGLLGLTLLMIGCGAAWMSMDISGSVKRMICAVNGLIGIGLSIYLLYEWLGAVRWCEVYQDGLAWKRGWRRRSAGWQDIFELVVTRPPGESESPTVDALGRRAPLTVLLRNGAQSKFDGALSDFGGMNDSICKLHGEALAADIAAGEAVFPVSFGRIHLLKNGIDVYPDAGTKCFVSWKEFNSVEQKDGKLELHTGKLRYVPLNVSLTSISNLGLLLEVLESQTRPLHYDMPVEQPLEEPSPASV